MSDGIRDVLGVHACACNGRVLETLEPWWAQTASCLCDGEDAGEGPAAIRKLLQKEFDTDVVARVVQVGDGPALVAYEGPEGNGPPRAVVRFETAADRVTSCRVEHDVARLMA